MSLTETIRRNFMEEKFPDTSKKYDTGKAMVGQMEEDFSKALLAVSEISRYGIEKYQEPGSWKHVENGLKRYKDARGRHQLKAYFEDYDDESGYLHLCHAAWNALAILQFVLENGYKVRDIEYVTKPVEGIDYKNCEWE